MSGQDQDVSGQDEQVTQQGLRRGTLGVFGIAFFVISAAAPLTAMAGGAPVAMLLGNGAGLPLAYVIVVVILLVFAVGYTTMARHHVSAGAFYSYIARGLHPQAGGAAAYLALLGYNAMQIGLYGLFGAAASGFVQTELGPNLPWWVYVFVGIAVISVLGYRQIDVSMKVLGVLVACEFAVVLGLICVIAVKGGDFGSAGLSAAPFSWSKLMSGSLAIALLFNFASFVGFEATAIYSEEAKEPTRTVPRATYVSVLIIGGFYTLATWLTINAAGVDNIPAYIAKLDDPTTFLFSISDKYIGSGYTTVMRLLFVTSVFAALLAFHNAVARYTYALGREGLLPSRAGSTHPVHGSPHIGSVVQTAVAAVVILAFVVSGADPVLKLFAWLTNLGTLGVLVLMSLSSLSVLAFFRRNPGLESSTVRTLVAPGVAAVALAAVTCFATSKFGLLIGADNALAWILPSLLVVAAVLGILAARWLRSRDPVAYEQMGQHRP